MTIGDVHVGDIGTLYRGEIVDAGFPFDPSPAVEKILLFETPNGVLTRSASVTTTGTGPDQRWFLEYQLNEIDDVTFHARQGTYRWQGYMLFANGHRYHTNIETYLVKPNIGGLP